MSAIRSVCMIASLSPPQSTPLHLSRSRFSTHCCSFRILRRSEPLRSRSNRRRTPLIGSINSSSSMDANGSISSSSIDPAYTEIIVIRHGETEWNADGRIQGHLDVALNDTGRQQAAAVAERLSKELKICAVYSSDLKRASDTAEMIANSCGGIEVIKYPELRERNLGDLQGHVYSELHKTVPKAYQAFTSNRTDQEIPGGGESIDQLYERCTSSLQKIANKHRGERVVVVTHGGVIRTLYRRASPSARPGKILNTSINVLSLSDGDEWMIKSWGDVSHLNRTGVLESAFGGDKHSG